MKECENELKEAIVNICKKYEKKKLKILNLEYTQFIQEEIKWIKACNYIKLEEYQEANRIGRINKTSNDISKILRKNSKQRQAIYDILIEYNNNLKKINKIDTQDMELLALEQAMKNPNSNYTHIFIDNSQYLTKVQLEFLKALYNEKSYSSITFIVNNIENINPNAWITKGRSFSSLGYDMKGKCITLNELYNEVQVKEIEESKDKKDNLTQNDEINKGTLENASLNLGTLEYIGL
ncbi:UvrD-helicase domain-containing protein [Clostridium sp.]|uniref:UvrD-helicase domain-containing protein n=1 Tax=Clostridium sp. TaxID=1506 RepID=UPI0025B7DF10|nr:UvrD-helicase domain-containing protein [Clostridium sp.]